MNRTLPILTAIAAIALSSCSGTTRNSSSASTDTENAIETSIAEMSSNIDCNNWEKARIEAETAFDRYDGQLTALQAAKMVAVYIRLSSEPDLQPYRQAAYAKRITALYEYAMATDSATAGSYFRLVGGESMIRETYENCRYITDMANQANQPSTEE